MAYTDPAKKRAYTKKWRLANHDRVRRYQRFASVKRLYGLSQKDYKLMLVRAMNRCEICKDHRVVVGRLNVDHDHKTGIVRGLLCTACNHGLGKFRDSTLRLQRAIMYLGSFNAK